MKTKALIISIILISFSFLGILLLQFSWISNIAELKEDAFDQNVHQAMNNAINKLEKQESAALLIQTEALVSNDTRDSNNWYSTQDSIFYSIKNRFILDSSLMHFKNNNLKTNHKIRQESPIIRESLILRNNGENTVIKNWTNDNSQLLQNESNKKLKHFTNVAKELVIELNQRNYANQYNLDYKKIQNLLKEALINNGINLPFDFSISTDQKSNPIYSSTKTKIPDTEKTYHAKLYPNTLFENKMELSVYFPSGNKYIIKSIFSQLLASIILTIITSITFWYTIKTIRKQKKISDIKSDFINNMTHEFKTPIATIALASDSINNDKILSNQESVKKFTKIIKEENQRMNNHVERVLQMSQMEKQEFKLKIEKFDAQDRILSTVNSFKLRLEERNGKISTDFAAQNHFLNTDLHHFENVISNLIDNAIKYNRENPLIVITTKNDSNQLIIEISDNGMGIKKEDLKYIFEKFYRVPTGNIHNIKGFGLGLNYSKQIIEKMDGKITVSSELNKGTTFTISIPTYKSK